MEDVLVRAGKFIFPVDFIVLDFEEDENVPLILGMPFFYTAKAIIDVYDETLTLRVGEKSCKFNIYQGMKHSFESDLCSRVDVLHECVIEVQRRRLANCDELEYIEKCMQVQSSQDKKFQCTTMPVLCVSDCEFEKQARPCHFPARPCHLLSQQVREAGTTVPLSSMAVPPDYQHHSNYFHISSNEDIASFKCGGGKIKILNASE